MVNNFGCFSLGLGLIVRINKNKNKCSFGECLCIKEYLTLISTFCFWPWIWIWIWISSCGRWSATHGQILRRRLALRCGFWCFWWSCKKEDIPCIVQSLLPGKKSVTCVIACDLSSNKTQGRISCSSSKHPLFSSAGFSISRTGSDLRICKVHPYWWGNSRSALEVGFKLFWVIDACQWFGVRLFILIG